MKKKLMWNNKTIGLTWGTVLPFTSLSFFISILSSIISKNLLERILQQSWRQPWLKYFNNGNKYKTFNISTYRNLKLFVIHWKQIIHQNLLAVLINLKRSICQYTLMCVKYTVYYNIVNTFLSIHFHLNTLHIVITNLSFHLR